MFMCILSVYTLPLHMCHSEFPSPPVCCVLITSAPLFVFQPSHSSSLFFLLLFLRSSSF